MTNPGNLAPGEVIVDILQVLLKFLQGFALGHIVRELLYVPQPHVFILPVYVSHCFHGPILPPSVVRFNHSISRLVESFLLLASMWQIEAGCHEPCQISGIDNRLHIFLASLFDISA